MAHTVGVRSSKCEARAQAYACTSRPGGEVRGRERAGPRAGMHARERTGRWACGAASAGRVRQRAARSGSVCMQTGGPGAASERRVERGGRACARASGPGGGRAGQQVRGAAGRRTRARADQVVGCRAASARWEVVNARLSTSAWRSAGRSDVRSSGESRISIQEVWWFLASCLVPLSARVMAATVPEGERRDRVVVAAKIEVNRSTLVPWLVWSVGPTGRPELQDRTRVPEPRGFTDVVETATKSLRAPT
jgi:hypothetical protein